MIKYLLVLVVLYVIPSQSFSQTKNGYTISGHIVGLKEGSVVYLTKDKGGKDTISKAVVRKEKFIFRGVAPQEAEIHFLKVDRSVSKKAKTLFLDNSFVQMNGDTTKWPNGIKVTGSQTTTDYYNLMGLLDTSYERISNIKRAIAKKRNDLFVNTRGNKESKLDTSLLKEEIAFLENDEKAARDQYYKLWIDYIIARPNSLYTPHSLSNLINYLGTNKAKEFYENLTSRAKKSIYGIKLKRDIELVELGEKIGIGKVIPDFNVSSPEGRSFSIKQEIAKSKVTLLDFWASWCKPCRAEIPNLKEAYSKFREKGFNIIGISSDDSKKAWEKALIQDSTVWIHGIQDKEKSASKIFDIRGIPAFILVDTHGNILGLDLSASNIPSTSGSLSGKNLHSLLSRILNDK